MTQTGQAGWHCAAADVGEHTDDVLAGLGYDPDTIAEWHADKIVV